MTTAQIQQRAIEHQGEACQAVLNHRIIVDIYCRVSTDDQEDNTSLETQEEEGRKFAKEHGFIVGEVYLEVESGFTLDREKLEIMRKRYTKHLIQGVIVYKFSRLARKHAFLSYLMVEMELAGCELYSVKEKIEKDEHGEFKIFLEGFFAQRERNETVDRTKTGRFQSAARNGNVAVGRKPIYGIDWVEGEKKTRRRLPVKIGFVTNEHIEAVEKIFAWFDDGRALNWIRRELIAQGYPPPEKVWNIKSIKRILRDKRYTGCEAQVFNSTDTRAKYRIAEEPVTIPGVLYPKIIDMDLYQRVQERLDSNAHEPRTNEALAEYFLLRNGFVYCSICGKMMRADHDIRNKEWSRYICRTRTDSPHLNRGEKHFLSISSLLLDQEVWSLVEQLASHLEFIQQAIKAISRDDIRKFRINSLRESINRHQASFDLYDNDLKAGRVPDNLRAMVYQKMSIEQEAIEALTEQLTEIQSQEGIAELIQKEYQEIEEWCERIRNGKALEGENEEKGLSYKAKRRFMKMLGVRVTIKPGTSPKGEKYKTIDKDRYEFGIDLPKIQELSSLGQGVKEVGQEDSYQHLGRSSDIDALALASAQ